MKISVKTVPDEIINFLLAKEFGWDPEKINRQNVRDIRGMLTVLSKYNEVQSNIAKSPNKNQNQKTFMKDGKQYVNITDPETEKAVAEGRFRI